MTMITGSPAKGMTTSDDPTAAQVGQWLKDFGVTPCTPAAMKVELMHRIDLIAKAVAPNEPPACPAWCVLPSGHVYQEVDCDDATVLETRDVTLMRDHESSSAGAPFMTQRERWRASEVTFEAPEIIFVGEPWGEPPGTPWTPTSAREHAAALLHAADVLEAATA